MEYEVTRRNEVRQLKDKARYDRETIHGILDAGLYAQVAFCDEHGPAVVPMIYARAGERLYLHGARKARVIRVLERGSQVAINVTLIDGIVAARSAFNSSMNYRSATVYGVPRLLERTQEKLEAMRLISEHLMPGRWEELRAPLEREVKMTGVIVVDVERASAKVSAGPPDDEDEDYALPVWAGVVPVRQVYGEPEADPRLSAGISESVSIRRLADTGP